MCPSSLGRLNHKRRGCFQEITTGALDAGEDAGKLMSLTFYHNRRKKKPSLKSPVGARGFTENGASPEAKSAKRIELISSIGSRDALL